jgi:hypothetical protein
LRRGVAQQWMKIHKTIPLEGDYTLSGTEKCGFIAIGSVNTRSCCVFGYAPEPLSAVLIRKCEISHVSGSHRSSFRRAGQSGRFAKNTAVSTDLQRSGTQHRGGRFGPSCTLVIPDLLKGSDTEITSTFGFHFVSSTAPSASRSHNGGQELSKICLEGLRTTTTGLVPEAGVAARAWYVMPFRLVDVIDFSHLDTTSIFRTSNKPA